MGLNGKIVIRQLILIKQINLCQKFTVKCAVTVLARSVTLLPAITNITVLLTLLTLPTGPSWGHRAGVASER